jgi:hypothetical protein
MPRAREQLPPPTAAVALAGLTVDVLRTLAVTATGEPGRGRKAELVGSVAAALGGDGPRRLYETLGELERAAVAEAVHAPQGRFDHSRFRAKYGRDPRWGSLRRGAQVPPTALDLLFCGDRTLPVDVRDRLREVVPAPVDSRVQATGEPSSAIVVQTEHAAQRDVMAVLRLAEAGALRISPRTQRPAAATLRVVAEVLDGGDFYADEDGVGAIKAFAWPLLVQAAGLATTAGSRLALTRAGKRALTDAPATTLTRAWTRWQSTTLLDELSRIDAIKGQRGRGRCGLTAVAGRRAAIAAALSECPVGQWVSVDELFRHMRSADLDFAVTRDAWGLYISEPEYGSLGYDGCGGWDILQARYALALLLEYAATLGVVDVALAPPDGARHDYGDLWGTDDLGYLSRYDGLTHIRVNAIGALCLGIADAYQPAPTEVCPALCVLPDLEVAALGDELTHADRLTLERFADRTGDRVWRLRPERLTATVAAGDSLDRIREFLTARTDAPLPPTVVTLLDDVARRARALTDRGAARLIECGDPALAVLLARDPATRDHCLLAGDRTLVVPLSAEAAFRRAASRLGYALGTGSDRHAA